jgi:hypothetical protein
MVENKRHKKSEEKLVRPLLGMGRRERINSVRAFNTVWQEEVVV